MNNKMNNNIVYYSEFTSKSSPVPIPSPQPKKCCNACSQRYCYLPIPSSVPKRKVKEYNKTFNSK